MANLNRPRPRWTIAALGTALGALIAGVALMNNVLAVDIGIFELDGNVKDDTGNSLTDWQTVFGLGSVVPPQTGTPVDDSPDKTFIHDVPTGSPAKETMYDAGKDIQDTTQWTRKSVTKVVPDKDNILDAFAVQTSNTNGDKIVYFGADRLANNGDATLSFWFFRSPLSESGSNGFTPGHTAPSGTQRGDILVQVDFLNGGGESRLRVFEWVGSGGSDGSLNLLRPAADVNGNTVCLSDDTACATTNNVDGVDSYWPYTPKAGAINKFPAESMFEGGINITRLVGDGCFNTFLASTRSSQQVTSDLKDYAMGEFNTCGSVDLVSKACKAVSGQSPLYLSGTDEYQYIHDVTIRNNGGGSLIYNVGFKDNIVAGTTTPSTRCSIEAITGGGGHSLTLPLQLQDNTTYVTVASSLAAGVANQMTVTVKCISPLKELHNSASIRASQTSGGQPTLTDTVAAADNDFTACETNFPAAVTLTKTCNGSVTLDAANGFAPKVCVQYVLTNTSGTASGTVAQKVNVESLIDYRLDGTSADLLSKLPNAVLDVGESNTIGDCYNPTKPDANETDPGLAAYSDSATVNARGVADPTLIDLDSNTATCPLCPPPPTN